MKQIFANRAVIAALTFFLGYFYAVVMRTDPPPSPAIVIPQTKDSEVSDLIARLAPLAKKPDGEWYDTGLTVKFSGRRSVHIELKTPDGNEYHGKAATLQEAAKRITEPSAKINEALQGWPPK